MKAVLKMNRIRGVGVAASLRAVVAAAQSQGPVRRGSPMPLHERVKGSFPLFIVFAPIEQTPHHDRAVGVLDELAQRHRAAHLLPRLEDRSIGRILKLVVGEAR